MQRRGPRLRWLLLAALLAEGAEAAPPAPGSAGAEARTPPPPGPDLFPSAPTPDWDVGVLAGVCGVGTTSVWQGTEFCGAVIADVLWLRKTRGSVGLGLYGLTGTAGFFDFRAGAGVDLYVPLGQLLSGSLRAGPLLHVMGDGAGAGWSLAAEFGVRALNQSGHYALTHTVVAAWDQSFGDGSRIGSALTIALRIDGFWLAAPVGLLF